jgi:hypothetical protein
MPKLPSVVKNGIPNTTRNQNNTRHVVKVSALLNVAAIDLVDAGKQKFSTSFFFLARKK